MFLYASSKWNFSESTKAIIFWIFGVKSIIFTNLRHYSTSWRGFFGFWDHLLDFFRFFFYLEHFWKMQCSEIYCAFVWHPNTLKLNSIIKNISDFMKYIKKNSRKKNCWKLWFLTILLPTTRPQLESSSHLYCVILSI